MIDRPSTAPWPPGPDGEAGFRLLFEHLGDVFWVIDWRSRRQVYVSPGFEREWGFSAEALFRGAPHWPDHIAPADRPAVEHAFQELSATGKLEISYRIVLPDGTLRWVRDRGIAVRDAAGAIVRVIGVAEDVTEKAEQERALIERNERLKLALDAARMSTWTVELSTRAVSVGPDFRAIVGVAPDTPIDGRMLERLSAIDVGRLNRRLDAAFRDGRPFDVEVRVRGDDGVQRWINTQAMVIRDERGAAIKALGVVSDVTARIRALQERETLLMREQAAREQAEAATRARDQFLAIVSHELRSPLNAIQSWVHVLDTQLAAPRTPLAQRALAGVRTGVEQQDRLIEDLLDATRIMTGKLSLQRKPLRVRPVVEAAIESIRVRAEARGIRLDVALELDDAHIDGDSDRVQQIFWNLLSNAVKFTPEGGHVWVGLARDDLDMVFSVRDDGQGIAPSALPHIFDRFARADNASQRGHDGLGLGLAIVRHLCELHGGSVSAQSDGEGCGAAFTVRIPLLQVSHTVVLLDDAPLAAGTPRSQPLAGLRVLLVDDQPEARESLAAVLEHAGATLRAFGCAREALQFLERQVAPWPADVLISDIAMPGDDGYALLSRVRAHERLRPGFVPLPAIAFTAFAHTDDRIRALAAGFDLHLAKPAPASELIAAVAAVAGRVLPPPP